MSDSPGNNQHAPTQQRLQKAHLDGNFARSAQLSSLLFCCGAITVLLFFGKALIAQICDAATVSFAVAPKTTGADLLGESSLSLWNIAATLAPLLLMFCAAAWLAHAWQSRFRIFPAKLTVDVSRMKPGTRLANLFSTRTLWNATFGLLRVVCILGFGVASVWTMRERIGIVGMLPSSTLVNAVVEISMWVTGGALSLMAMFALIDWLWQRHFHFAGLKMSERELRDELKSSEGDPQIKSRQRSIQKNVASGRTSAVS